MSQPSDNPIFEHRRAHLYVGNLSPRVTEYMLTEIFAVAGHVQSVKIIPDRNFSHGGLNYGFVEYTDMRAAETALQTLNGRKIFDTEIRVNWAYQGNNKQEDTTNHFHVFVGDLSPEVNDEILSKAFSGFKSISDARVMWDMNTGKSRGYGFLSFREKTDAEQAISTMNGEWLGSRAIRVNWANQKTQTGSHRLNDLMPTMNAFNGPLSYEAVFQQTPAYNTTVYIGNLTPYTTQADLVPIFQAFGYIIEVRMQADRGFAFVKLDSHENASMAIVQLQGTLIQGRPIKCSWGRDRTANANNVMQQQNAQAAAAAAAAAAAGGPVDPSQFNGAYGQLPLYNLPQVQPYGAQFGYPPQANPAAAGVAMPGIDPNQWSQYFAAQQAAAAAQLGQQPPPPPNAQGAPSPYAAYAIPSNTPQQADQIPQ
ncbi:hypothetical protein E3Q11_03292 [Wallemia mellicola]|nr:hypothetical protein E3Q11_03292 [Wallemia mellicola]